jgi:hypothetical protein
VADGGRIDAPDERRHREMLLERDDTHGLLPRDGPLLPPGQLVALKSAE